MKNKGFTLIELLAIIILLGVLVLIVYPKILEVIEKKNSEIDKATLDIFYSAADEYMKKNPNEYPKIIGSTYNFCITTLDSENLIPIDITKYKDKDIQVKIGEKNSYSIGSEQCKLIGDETQNLLDNNTTYGNYTYMGGTYLKGVQESNYVWYNGFLWRIMGKNSDGSVRLITEENVTAIPYGADNQGLTYSSNTGYLNDWLNDYFYNNLDSSKTSIIKTSDWCINVTTSYTNTRIDCTGGTTINAKVGLITLDEYNLSGASYANSTYGLVNSQSFWTLTPYNSSEPWFVFETGTAATSSVDVPDGARPVINVETTATITGGNGTLADAYILNQTTSNKTGKLNDKASSGEYVSLSGKTYRVVSKDSIGTKLIYDGYYEEVEGKTTMMKYNETSTNVFSTSTGIGLKLNTDVLTWLGNSDKIVSTNWYQTSGFRYGTAYTEVLNDTSNPITDTKVGLIRVGEMMSGQSASILTKNYTVRSSYENAKYYWTMNKNSNTNASYAWYVDSGGDANIEFVTYTNGARPVIYVGTNTTITSGNGTLQSPYMID